MLLHIKALTRRYFKPRDVQVVVLQGGVYIQHYANSSPQRCVWVTHDWNLDSSLEFVRLRTLRQAQGVLCVEQEWTPLICIRIRQRARLIMTMKFVL